MNFDIAIGPCLSVDEHFAVVKLDGAMLRKLLPGEVFAVQINARLRVPLSICSTRRPPREGQELFLDYEKACDGAETTLDPRGRGEYADIDIRLLTNGIEPAVRPEPERKAGRAGWFGRTY